MFPWNFDPFKVIVTAFVDQFLVKSVKINWSPTEGELGNVKVQALDELEKEAEYWEMKAEVHNGI